MTTQLCFDPGAIGAWLAARRAEGLALPVHLGVPGVAEPHKLLAISARIGVADTHRFLTKNVRFVARLVRPAASTGPTACSRAWRRSSRTRRRGSPTSTCTRSTRSRRPRPGDSGSWPLAVGGGRQRFVTAACAVRCGLLRWARENVCAEGTDTVVPDGQRRRSASLNAFRRDRPSSRGLLIDPASIGCPGGAGGSRRGGRTIRGRIARATAHPAGSTRRCSPSAAPRRVRGASRGTGTRVSPGACRRGSARNPPPSDRRRATRSAPRPPRRHPTDDEPQSWDRVVRASARPRGRDARRACRPRFGEARAHSVAIFLDAFEPCGGLRTRPAPRACRPVRRGACPLGRDPRMPSMRWTGRGPASDVRAVSSRLRPRRPAADRRRPCGSPSTTAQDLRSLRSLGPD